jgi:toxin ParE1/3/4
MIAPRLRLEFARAARDDLFALIEYLAADNVQAAERLYQTIVRAVEHLPLFPEMGRAGRLPGTRELIVPGTPYLLVYLATAEAVTIVAVFHGARDLARALTERRALLENE